MKTYKIKNIFIAAFALCALTACNNDDDGAMDPDPMEVDFSGTYAQADHMGRPGINTVLSGTEAQENAQNTTIPSDMQAAFQGPFLDRAVALHAAFGAEYETNILGLDGATLTSVLADDVLDIAPEGITTYFGADSAGNQVVLTGRTPQDDVIDVSLILLFGGTDGMRFSGQDTNGDGTPDLPRLTSDGVAFSANVSTTFPYLGDPE